MNRTMTMVGKTTPTAARPAIMLTFEEDRPPDLAGVPVLLVTPSVITEHKNASCKYEAKIVNYPAKIKIHHLRSEIFCLKPDTSHLQ